MNERQKQILQECERFGENKVRRKLYSGEYTGSRDRSLVGGWLRDKESEREQEVSARREAREAESLLFSRKQTQLARWAIMIAIIATIIAIIAIVVPRENIKWVVTWLFSKFTS